MRVGGWDIGMGLGGQGLQPVEEDDREVVRRGQTVDGNLRNELLRLHVLDVILRKRPSARKELERVWNQTDALPVSLGPPRPRLPHPHRGWDHRIALQRNRATRNMHPRDAAWRVARTLASAGQVGSKPIKRVRNAVGRCNSTTIRRWMLLHIFLEVPCKRMREYKQTDERTQRNHRPVNRAPRRRPVHGAEAPRAQGSARGMAQREGPWERWAHSLAGHNGVLWDQHGLHTRPWPKHSLGSSALPAPMTVQPFRLTQ